MKSVEMLVQSYIDERAALGTAVALLQEGGTVYLGGFGTTSVEENGVEVTPRTLFAYGSISKNICAVLIMRLVEKDLLDLDTPIVHYLPDLQFSNAGYGGRITLRHLVSHTSGLPMGGKNWGPRDPDSLRRFVYEQIPHYAFLSEPGAVHLYSNTVFCVAGHVAEAVTGKFYGDLVQEYVFDPLQMARVTFDPVVAMTYPVALPHESSPEGELHVVHRMTYNASGNPSSFALGSVSDLANLAQMYLNQGKFGGQQFLTATSIAEMQRIHGSRHIEAALHPLSDNYLGYGLGFQVGEYRGRRAAGHGGMSLSYNCFFKLFPNERAGVVVLTNQCDDALLWDLVTSLYDHVLDLSRPERVSYGKPAAHATQVDGNQLQRYAGVYLRVETAELAIFDTVDDTLALQREGKAIPLIPVDNYQFYGQVSERYRLPVAFVSGASGQVAHVMIGGEPYHPFEVDRPFQPDLQLWKSFEGVYKDPGNSNFEEIFTVRLQEGVLFIAEGPHEVPSSPVGHRSFLSELGLFEFEDTQSAGMSVLVWGKTTRYYPLNAHAYRTRNVIKYLVDVPMVQPGAQPAQPPVWVGTAKSS